MHAKSALIATAAVASSLLFPSLAEARTNWQGEAVFTAVTTACASDGWAVGTHALVTFLPANLDNNGARSYLAFHINRRNAYSLSVGGNFVATAAYTAVAISSAGNNFTFGGSVTQYSQTPASLTLTTPFINTRGQVTNFAGMAGCTVTFEASFIRRR